MMDIDLVTVVTLEHAQRSWSQFDLCVLVCLLTLSLSLCCLQVVSAPGEPRSSLDLKPRLNYTIQVRCSSLDQPPLWSDWSEPHHIYLDSKNHSLPAVYVETDDYKKQEGLF